MLELVVGLVAGVAHTLSGPDHLAAVAPLALRHPLRAAGAGLRWGLGHALGVAALAGAGWWLRGVIRLELWSDAAERLVGVALIGIGLWALGSALRFRLHAHEHEHEGRRHVHVHVHGRAEAHGPGVAPAEAPRHAHTHMALGVGALHGFAGTAHLVGVLPALALPGWQETTLYVLGYGGGAGVAMAGFGWVIGRIATDHRFDAGRTYRALLSSAGVAALAVGAFWVVT